MTSQAFTLMFAFALLASVATKLWLATRQIRHVAAHRDAVPESFASHIDLAAHRRAAAYTIARTQLSIVESVFGALVLLGFTLFGGLQALLGALETLAPSSAFLRSMAFVAAVFAISALLELPFAWVRQFRIEQRFGFNRMTPRLFVADALKAAAVAIVLGAPLLALVLWLMRSSGGWWWLWVWASWAAFNVAVLVLYPTVIAPLFNRFEPLPDGELRSRVEALLARCGFATKGLFVMDGSRRSAHGNAYFTGLGRAKRIVFFDTLVSRLEAPEIEAVLAHELGHYVKRHVQKRIASMFAASLAGLWLLGWLSRQAWFYEGLGVSPGVGELDAAALVLFLLAMPVFAFPLQPLFAALSRRHEFEADAFATRHARAQDLVAALVKLYKDNASTLTPDPVHSAFYDSHPPASQRIGRLGAGPLLATSASA
ncbi:MAG: M48 family metallopeptidase [Burkholderiaceae bacterium]|nr:M48 family metallopeptidase [Burkholderiaceae bacterium]